MKTDVHIPVLLNEVIDGLNIKSSGIYVDLTLGRAGHSYEILTRLTNGLLIGIDQDSEAIAYSKEKLSKLNKNFKVIKGNFRNIDNLLKEININSIDGALFDLGVSSPQFDEDYRGFSYRLNERLDMRMDLNNTLNAHYIVNNCSLEKLVKIFKEYGEEKYSYSIAKNIISYRSKKEIETTQDLVNIIKMSKPSKELAKKGHPAKQVFQALRIEVNDELNALSIGLEKTIKLLNIDGRIAVITFQSLEDRIVKNIFKKYSIVEGNRLNDFKKPSEIEKVNYQLVNKKIITPTSKEIEENHRAKSAKLRIIKRVR